MQKRRYGKGLEKGGPAKYRKVDILKGKEKEDAQIPIKKYNLSSFLQPPFML